jgi:EF hand
MNRILTAAAPFALMVVLIGGQAWAQQTPATPAVTAAPDCAAMWTAADVNKDGSLAGDELKPYTASMAAIDTDNDGKISKAEFEAACKANKLPKS